jgi:PTS system nitrogen regulatory IIA component
VEVNFGYLLRTLRICAGLSLRELARSIDVSPTYLSLIENGKQPPPSPSRIAKIEQALEMPPGYLLSIARGFDPAALSYMQSIPETLDFLHMAQEKRLMSDDFMQLTAFLNMHGKEKLLQALQNSKPELPQAGAPPKVPTGAYLWPFLDENLIFDINGSREKEAFLKEAVERIGLYCNGFNPPVVLAGLKKREKIASTGIGRGVAVPHAYVPGLDRMVVAFVRIPQGLEFHSVDGEPIQLALFLAGPPSSRNLHLLLLARIAKLVRNRSFCQRVLRASTPCEIISTFRDAETSIP